MRSVPLPAHGSKQVSALGFGCAAVLGRTGRRESLAAIHAAFDAGITLYDTARSYGYGRSEGLVGEFMQGKRERIVLCTKFGILPAPNQPLKQMLKPVARAAVQIFPGLRKVAQQQAASMFQPGQFSVDALKTSFETSLRELRTEYVDMLLLHAAPASVLQQDDLLEAMGRLVQQGKVLMAGISGELPVIEETFRQKPSVLTTAQFALNLKNIAFTRETSRHAGMFLVGNHPFGGSAGVAGTTAAIERIRSSENLPATLREKLMPGDPQLMPEIVFGCILRGTGVSSVVAAMMQPKHGASNIRAVDECRFSDEELAMLREHLATAS
jgi:aryl-alcohol dehydrogenase-like predicted oxidoreductase